MNLFDYLYYRSYLETGRKRGMLRVPACLPVVGYAFLYTWMLGRALCLLKVNTLTVVFEIWLGWFLSVILWVYYLIRGKAIKARGDALREAGEARYAVERRVMTNMLIVSMALYIILFIVFEV